MNNKIKYPTNIPHIPFYFVRHGQTDWNKEHKIMGQIDIPLNAVGLQQAQAVAQNIAHLEISRIVSSPLKRAVQTSEIIAAHMNISITKLDEFTECSLGILEGRYKGDNELALIECWKKGGNIESSEHRSDFTARIAVGLNCALTSSSDKKPILIVAHRPTYWELLHILNAQANDTSAENCSVYFFSPPDLNSNQWVVNALENGCNIEKNKC